MESFEEIYARAVIRHDGEDAVEDNLPKPRSKRQLSALADDRCLAEMAKCIFRSGFVWRVVEAKWPGFEEAFLGFDPKKVSRMSDARLAELAADQRIIRHDKKIRSVHANAGFVIDAAEEHGSFGRFLAGWPEDDVVGLWLHLRKHGQRLGGATGPMFLRGVGKDTFVLTRDISDYVVEQGIVGKSPTGKGDLLKVQAAFNRWAEESGRPLCQVSRIVAMSHGDVREP